MALGMRGAKKGMSVYDPADSSLVWRRENRIGENHFAIHDRATLKRYLALPGTRSRTVAQWDYIPDNNPAFAQFHQRFTSGLRKAGMPDR